MMGKVLSIAVAAAFVTVLSFSSLSCGGNDDSEIRIGAILPLAGQVAFYGTESRDGGLLAIEEINARGGLLGKKVVFLSEDDEGRPEMTINAFTRLTTRERVSMIMGSSTSGATMAITDRAQSAGVLVISPSATSFDVTQAGDFIFRACFIDPFQGVVGADFAFGDLGARRAAVLFDMGADYNRGLAEAFRDRFVELGGEIVAWEAYQTLDVDFNAQVTRIRASAPDMVFLPNYYNDVALQAVQLRGQGVTVPLLGGDGWDGLVDNAGDEVVGGFWSSAFASDTTEPRGAAFVQAFQARFGRTASQFAALGYDSIMLIAGAIESAGSTDAALVRDAMARTDGYFVTGHIRFDANRNPIKSATILEIVGTDGRLANVYRTTVNPSY
jgi:branched-chain amino acid transport system substrate-binding protein